MRRRDCALNRLQRAAAVRLEIGYSPEQPARVRVCGGPENVLLRAYFHQAARVHDGDAIGNLRDDSQVMRNEEHRQSKLDSQLSQQFQNLRLDGHVERRGRFIGNQQLRVD